MNNILPKQGSYNGLILSAKKIIILIKRLWIRIENSFIFNFMY